LSAGAHNKTIRHRYRTGNSKEDMNMAVGVGDRLPEVTLPGLDGPMVALGGLRGKRRLLFFWGSW